MWQVVFVNAGSSRMFTMPAVKPRSVFDGEYDEIEIRQEWQEENTHGMGTRGNFSLSHRWIPRKDSAQQLMSGMNVNHSYGP